MTASSRDVWTAFSDRLRRFVRSRIRNEHDVDDILQDVFAKIHAGLGGLKDPSKLEAWLFQVTRRAIVDHVRSRRPAPRGETTEPEAPTEDVPAVVASWLRPMLELLPAEDREALRLTDVEGLPQKELAARLGLSATGAKSRVQRARKRLKETLLACCHVETDRRGNAIAYTPRRCSCS